MTLRNILIAGILLLAGCSSKQLTNEQIIAESMRCDAAGMETALLPRYGSAIVIVECRPRAYR